MSEYATYKIWDGCSAPYNLEAGGRLIGQRVYPVTSSERTCRWSYDDATDSWDTECGGKVLWDNGAPKCCPECGGMVVTE